MKGANWVLAGLMGLIGGVVSCDSEENMVCMYGTPHASYDLKGKVVNNAGAPISGIEVKAGTKWSREELNMTDYPYKTLTDAKGEYAFTLHTVGKNDFTVYASDIDGEANGAWQKDSIAVKGSEINMTGEKGAWEDGKGSATVNFTLREETK